MQDKMQPGTDPAISEQLYCASLTTYIRRKTSTVTVGDLLIGSDHPIRVQSMTTTDTMDTMASVEQVIRMVNAGCELVRLTAPGINDARNLANIKEELRKRGVHVPLVADIHFTPNAAEAAARIVEKVRINPGNYVDKKKFEQIEYTDAEYAEEIERIRKRFTPLVAICKEYGTAMRIGTNHGSLSDRIMSRYGDSPMGMVESAMEFLRIAGDLDYHNIVLSMKSSNPKIMVEAYRLLVKVMNANNMFYPLHLGVTEAGEGDDGRIKSAMGIGALLEDGIGDTIRVSLTEDPEFEVPVAKKLVARYDQRKAHQPVPFALKEETATAIFSPYDFRRRNAAELLNIGGHQVPRVIADMSKVAQLEPEHLKHAGHIYYAPTDKWLMTDQGCDYIYRGKHPTTFMLPMGLKGIYDAGTWNSLADKVNNFPLFNSEEFANAKAWSQTLNFLRCSTSALTPALIQRIEVIGHTTLVLETDNEHAVADMRNAFLRLETENITCPVIISRHYDTMDEESFILFSSTDAGSLLVDGFGDGLMISAPAQQMHRVNAISFGILQAARARITKTEYISCPSCGRTLFDLQETTAIIRKQTDHLKGIKIAIMGCIVNGPGEMADADYGYVGSGPGKITLYRGREVVKKGISKETAVQELIGLIREDGQWTEPGTKN
jgi:(E)-4-hydroxy-3-methylbut-2-enyl-diphosphate synthase